MNLQGKGADDAIYTNVAFKVIVSTDWAHVCCLKCPVFSFQLKTPAPQKSSHTENARHTVLSAIGVAIMVLLVF